MTPALVPGRSTVGRAQGSNGARSSGVRSCHGPLCCSGSASELRMNVPTRDQTRLVIVGSTGMVGGYALRYALDHPAVKSATAIVRRKLDISHPKLNQLCTETSRTAPHS